MEEKFSNYDDSAICENCDVREVAEDGHLYCSQCLAWFKEQEKDSTTYADAAREVSFL